MLLCHTDSWHYRLVLYIFTKEFFLERVGIDYEAMESQYDPQTKQEKEFKMIYKKKTKTINFCPYCRAVVAAIASVPFVYLWRLYPHKPKPKKTHEEVMKGMRRRSQKIKIIVVTLNVITGIMNIVNGMYNGINYGVIILGIFQLVLAAIYLTGHLWGDKFIKWIVVDRHEIRQKLRISILKLISVCYPKWMRRTKPKKIKKESKIMQKIKSSHDVYCPPIFFVENVNKEKLK